MNKHMSMHIYCIIGIFNEGRGSQRDVVYLGWPIAPSYLSPNAGVAGSQTLSQWVQLCIWSPNKLWRSISMKVYCTIDGNKNNADIRLESSVKERRNNSALTRMTFENTTDALHYRLAGNTPWSGVWCMRMDARNWRSGGGADYYDDDSLLTHSLQLTKQVIIIEKF